MAAIEIRETLDDEERSFLTSATGVTDPEALWIHIQEVQAEAFEVFPYSCIQNFGFARLKISRLRAYDALLRLGREDPHALLLDIGCCFGNDVRKAIADGFPATQIIASDIHPQFWALGHSLFNSTPETFPVPFIPGDVFDPAHLAPAPISYTTSPAGSNSSPDLHALTSLTPLHGRLSAIHASAFFHLFPESAQLTLARRLASLLSPAPGSVIFGAHGGLPTKGLRERFGKRAKDGPMFCHDPESWRRLWEEEVFEKGTVKVEVELVERKAWTRNARYQLRWSVTRI